MSAFAEYWRAVPGFEGWTDVSSWGRVRRWYRYESGGRRLVWLDEPILVSPGECGGYKRVPLQNEAGGPVRSAPLHCLVLESHIGPRPEGFLACHFPNKDRGCCELSSLRWDSHSENVEDDRAHRTCDRALILDRLLRLRETHAHLRCDIDGLTFNRPRTFVPRLDAQRRQRGCMTRPASGVRTAAPNASGATTQASAARAPEAGVALGGAGVALLAPLTGCASHDLAFSCGFVAGCAVGGAAVSMLFAGWWRS